MGTTIKTTDVVRELLSAVPAYLDTLTPSEDKQRMAAVVEFYDNTGYLRWDTEGSGYVASPLALLARSVALTLSKLSEHGVTEWEGDAMRLGRSYAQPAAQLIIDALAVAEERMFPKEQRYDLLEKLMDEMFCHLLEMPAFEQRAVEADAEGE